MKILHILSERSWRGGEQQAAYLIEVCQQENIACYVACRENSAFNEYCVENNIKRVTLPFRGQFDIQTAQKIKKYCVENQIDLMHLHTANAHGIGVISHLLGNHIPMILSRRVIFPVQNKQFSRYKYNYPGIEKIICASEAIKHVVIESIQQKDKCLTIYDGIDIAKFNVQKTDYLRKKYRINSDTFLIGNISALDINKGLYTYIDVAEKIIQQGINAKFFIIGEGPLRHKLESYILKKKLKDQVILTGFIKNIANIMHELDLFVLTTLAEGLGTSLLDAMACQLPVIATNTGGVPEVVLHELTGLLSPVGDVDSISKQIIRLINDKALCNKLIKNAKEHLLKYFTKNEMGHATIDIYRHIIRCKQQQILISVIVTTYNRPDALKLVLTGLNQQDMVLGFEVIIADDGSTPATRNLVMAMKPTLRYPLHYLWQEDKGFRAAKMRNKAIANAHGAYIIFLDGDCIPRSSFVRRHYQLAEKKHFVVGNRVLLSPSFTNEAIKQELRLATWTLNQWHHKRKPNNYNRLSPLLTLPLGVIRKIYPKVWRGAKTCNLSAWKADLIAINGFDETYQGWGYEDSDLVIRLIRHGIQRKIGHFSVPVLHLWHPENDRSQESENLARLKMLLESNNIRANLGLSQYLSPQENSC